MSAKILYLESISGIAGDMFAASFADAGLVSAEELQKIPELLGFSGVRVELKKVVKASMNATHVNVVWSGEQWKEALGHRHAALSGHHHAHGVGKPEGLVFERSREHWHTHYVDLDAFLEKSKLVPGAKKLARDVFRFLAEAEAEAHGVALEEVAFHEVGAVDSIVDVAMAAYCVSKLSPKRILASALKLGRGMIQIEHGTHAVPPPATARLSIGMPIDEVPVAITRPNVELSTPTGVAILKALNPQFVNAWPKGKVLGQGMGAGTMDLGSYPNVFRVVALEETAQASLPYESDQVVEISFNVDDSTAERTAWLMQAVMEQGALDVWAAPITGKKNRPALCLSVLCELAGWEALADWILRQSSTFGIRYCIWDRLKLARRIERRQTPQGEVAYKVGLTTTGIVLKEKPEFEDLKKIWDRESSSR